MNDSLKYRRDSHPDFWLEEEIRNEELPPPSYEFWLDAVIILFGLLGAFVGIGGLLLFLFGVPT